MFELQLKVISTSPSILNLLPNLKQVMNFCCTVTFEASASHAMLTSECPWLLDVNIFFFYSVHPHGIFLFNLWVVF